jgi:hypothetical protein
MKPVILESPYAGHIELNTLYAQFAMHDCLVNHNEAPYASHLLYTQPNVLRDEIPEDRKLGIEAGFVWRGLAEQSVFYIDQGISKGMQLGIDDAVAKTGSVIKRSLPEDLFILFAETAYSQGKVSNIMDLFVLRDLHKLASIDLETDAA